jgi:diacylglycerol O-acyltransferase
VPTERLRTQDAALWCVQAPDAPLQVGALCLFEAGPLRDEQGVVRLDEIRRRFESRLAQFPRLRQRLVPVPFDQGRPIWVDDADFDIAHHIRLGAVPQPGDDAQLRELVSRFIEVPLDPNRPLWEIWVIEGVSGDRVAVMPKVSHVMADGMAVLEFSLAALDLQREVDDEEPEPWQPAPGPTAIQLLVGGITERTRRGAGALIGAATALARPWQVVGRLGALAGAGTSTAKFAPKLPFTRAVGPHRDFTWIGLPMADLVEVKRARRVTLNDVGLTIAAGALRHYLDRTSMEDDDVERIRPRVLVPVSTHVTVAGEIENRFSMMVADLPLGPADPVEQLTLVHEEMERRKESAQSTIGPVLFGLADVVPEWALRRLGPPLLRRQPVVNLAVTNLPGTRDAMYLLGSKMLELYPYVAVTGNISVIIGLLSYGDRLGVGITVDSDAVPHADLLVEGIERASRELVDAVLSDGRSASPDDRPEGTHSHRSTGVATRVHAVGE